MKENIAAIYPLLPMQQGMFVSSLHEDGSEVYFEQSESTIEGAVDVDRFRAAWQRVVDRHGALRTVFAWKRTKVPLQIILKKVDLDFTLLDWSHLDLAAADRAFDEFRRKDRTRGFDLAKKPPFRIVLVRLNETRFRCLTSSHHLILDGWSSGLISQEFLSFYEDPSQQPPPAPQIGAYVQWVKQQDRTQAQRFWADVFAGWEPADPLPLARKTAGTPADRQPDITRSFSEAETRLFSERARELRLSEAVLAQAAWALVLARLDGRREITYGAVVPGRPSSVPGAVQTAGLFINTLPVRAHIDWTLSGEAWLRQFQKHQLALMAHESSVLMDIHQWAGIPANQTLYDTFFSYLNFPRDPNADGDDRVAGLRFTDARTYEKNDLPLALIASKDKVFSTTLIYDEALYTAREVGFLLEAYSNLLLSLCRHPQRPLSQLVTIDPQERNAQLARAGAAYDLPECSLGEAFDQSVAQFDTRIALEGAAGFGSTQHVRLTYSELKQRIDRLAGHLAQQGIGPGDILGVHLHASVETVITYVAVVKTGAGYLPLDPDYPVERLAFMLEDAGAKLILGESALASVWPDQANLMLLDQLGPLPEVAVPEPGIDSDYPAYIIYTSGSTGRPKGNYVSHRNVFRLVKNTNYLPFEPENRIAQAVNTAFDITTLEVWGALLNGAAVIIMPNRIPDATQLGSFLADHRIDTMWLTTGLFNSVVDVDPRVMDPLRHLLVGGEALSVHHICKAAAALPRTQIYNAYGPTENTGITTFHPVTAELTEDAASVPIGKPIHNSTVYVLDSFLNPVPSGWPGALYTGGVGLAFGYYNRPGLTAEVFVPNPFAEGERLYHTGDLAMWDSQDRLCFLGRVDHQIKLRGYRIEPGEIKNALETLPEIDNALVRLVQPEQEAEALAAYIVAPEPVDEDDLREKLAESLPGYMIPRFFVFMERLPLTPNGKVDTRALPIPQSEDVSEQAGPANAVEEILAGIFAEVLGRDTVSSQADFFDLGGQSLLATKVVTRVRDAFDTALPVRAIFDHPTPAGLAKALETGQKTALHPVIPIARVGRLPVSFAQRRLWFLDQLEGAAATYNIHMALRLHGTLDVDRLQATLHALMDCQEGLRTTFVEKDGAVYQHIAAEQVLPWRFEDLSGQPLADAQAQAHQLIDEAAHQPFNLAKGPLFRVLLHKLAADQHVLTMVFHHIVFDGWSMNLLLAALEKGYRTGGHLEAPPVQYADYAQWQTQFLDGPDSQRQLAYWQDQLAEVPTLDLPTDYLRPAVQTHHGHMVSLGLPDELSQTLTAFSRAENVTTFMTLMAVFQVLLSRMSGQRDFCVGTPVANRQRPEVEGIMGFFVNTLVFRARLDEVTSFAEFLKQVRTTTLTAQQNQDLPFEQIVEAVSVDRDLSRSPLFDVMFAMQNGNPEGFQMDDLEAEAFPIVSQTTLFDMTLFASEAGGQFELTLEYNRDLFSEPSAERLLQRYVTLLDEAMRHPTIALEKLAMIGANEAARLAEFSKGPTLPQPSFAGIHRGIEAIAKNAPNTTALYWEQHSLTYGELDGAANRLAHHLRAQGVREGDFVGVCLPRRPELVISLLAVLKAGAAYVPLDPTYPRERLTFILEDTQPQVLITSESDVNDWPVACTIDPLAAEKEQDPSTKVDPGSPHISLAAHHLSHVIYTSGSTGQPKGVAIRHQSSQCLIDWARGEFPPHVLAGVLASTSVCFDLSVFELFVTLNSGGAIILVDDALGLAHAPAAERVTLINSVPSAMTELLNLHAVPATVATVNLAGEPLDRQLVQWIYTLGHVDQVYNLYGPSEDTTYSTVETVPNDNSMPCIGRPVANTAAYVLDEGGQPVGIGVPGELFLSGDKVATGYLHRPQLTEERFLDDPFRSGQRMYRTGDLCRWDDSGRLHFCGRRDHQVKLRGFRIELGEIEDRLNQMAEVQQAVVRVKTDASGDPMLAAYLTLTEEQAPEPGLWRERLASQLPGYMVPASFMVLPAFPLTANGKINSRALPIPQVTALTQTNHRPPATELERDLAKIWSDVLGNENLGRDDNFFALGGHSLKVTAVIARMRRDLGLDLSVRDFFAAPSLRELAQAVQPMSAQTDHGPITVVPDAAVYPMTPAQKTMWYACQSETASKAYIISSAMRLSGHVDEEALGSALIDLGDYHESLRTVFDLHHDVPVQRVLPSLIDFFECHNLTRASQPEQIAREMVRLEYETPFDITRGPLFRARLLKLADREHVLLMTMHHLISDGWSFNVLTSDLLALYRHHLEGTDKPSRPRIQYRDYANWLNHRLADGGSETARSFWTESLSDVGEPVKPSGRTLSGDERFTAGSHEFWLEPSTFHGLNHLAKDQGTTLFVVLQAALHGFLHRITGAEDIVIGTPVSGRIHPDTEHCVGLFLNMLPLRATVHADLTFDQVVAQTHQHSLAAFEHQSYPFEWMKADLREQGQASQDLLHCGLTLQNQARSDVFETDLFTISDFGGHLNYFQYQLWFLATPIEDRLHFLMTFNQVLFEEQAIESLTSGWLSFLEQVAQNPSLSLNQVQLTHTETVDLLDEEIHIDLDF